MRPRNERRNRIFDLGVIMLVSELFNVGYDAIPPVTLVTIVSQVLLYVGVIDVPWSKWDVCISAKKVWEKKDIRSLIFSSFEHADDMHLYYNMISFLVKGRSLEYRYGTANFGILLAILSLMTSCIYVALSIVGAHILANKSMLSTCAIGFSGVIFALKLITTLENPVGHRYVAGIRVPTRYTAWAELIAIHMLVPNASFVGHLAGIIAGLIYMKTFIGTLIDAILYSITGQRMVHYGRYGWNYDEASGYRQTSSNNFFTFGSPWRNGYGNHRRYY